MPPFEMLGDNIVQLDRIRRNLSGLGVNYLINLSSISFEYGGKELFELTFLSTLFIPFNKGADQLTILRALAGMHAFLQIWNNRCDRGKDLVGTHGEPLAVLNLTSFAI